LIEIVKTYSTTISTCETSCRLCHTLPSFVTNRTDNVDILSPEVSLKWNIILSSFFSYLMLALTIPFLVNMGQLWTSYPAQDDGTLGMIFTSLSEWSSIPIISLATFNGSVTFTKFKAPHPFQFFNNDSSAKSLTPVGCTVWNYLVQRFKSIV